MIVIVVAVLLLPLLSALLIVMDRVEDHLLHPVRTRRRHAGGRRQLRLIRGDGRRYATGNPERHPTERSAERPAEHLAERPAAAGGPEAAPAARAA
ncbi:hypothetical protein [Streptomyces adustus]|uniref:hypothetical protein n=1 Tax=Streptomyces adustus TaxID=1609272 RepID=UPI00128D98C0|nr:hypothetical protein [Streptomyces adustus]